ncbi:MAG: hypothetical protein ACYTX0_51360, partial [Nostoc sp.]
LARLWLLGGRDAHPTINSWIFFYLEVSNSANFRFFLQSKIVRLSVRVASRREVEVQNLKSKME